MISNILKKIEKLFSDWVLLPLVIAVGLGLLLWLMFSSPGIHTSFPDNPFFESAPCAWAFGLAFGIWPVLLFGFWMHKTATRFVRKDILSAGLKHDRRGWLFFYVVAVSSCVFVDEFRFPTFVVLPSFIICWMMFWPFADYWHWPVYKKLNDSIDRILGRNFYKEQFSFDLHWLIWWVRGSLGSMFLVFIVVGIIYFPIVFFGNWVYFVAAFLIGSLATALVISIYFFKKSDREEGITG